MQNAKRKMQNECACGAYKKASSVGFAATFSEGRRLTDTETANINGNRRAKRLRRNEITNVMKSALGE